MTTRNLNAQSINGVVDALSSKVYVMSVVPVMEEGKKVVYSIIFSSGDPVTIYDGKDGKDGKPGDPGAAGKDGVTPVVGLRLDTDGLYYWTLNGECLLGPDGQKAKAEGKDGSGGVGSGKDGITPKLRINSSANVRSECSSAARSYDALARECLDRSRPWTQ